jgi:lipid-binding SYLF domain-containing protein
VKKLTNWCAAAAFVLVLFGRCASADTEREKAEERLQRSASVLQEIMNARDKGIPEEVIKGAKCIAVIPHEIKAGFIFGARVGKGVATCRTQKGWSAPAFFSVTGGSWGAQIGIEGIDNVLMIMNEKGMAHLLLDKFKIGADASAAAGPIGRHAEAGTDWKLDTEILKTLGDRAGLFGKGGDLLPSFQLLRFFLRRGGLRYRL